VTTAEATIREARTITDRIKKVEVARAMAENGRFDEALSLLRRVRLAYREEHLRRKVDWVIAEVEQARAGR